MKKLDPNAFDTGHYGYACPAWHEFSPDAGDLPPGWQPKHERDVPSEFQSTSLNNERSYSTIEEAWEDVAKVNQEESGDLRLFYALPCPDSTRLHDYWKELIRGRPWLQLSFGYSSSMGFFLEGGICASEVGKFPASSFVTEMVAALRQYADDLEAGGDAAIDKLGLLTVQE